MVFTLTQILFEHSEKTIEDSMPQFQLGFQYTKGLYLESPSGALQFASLIFPRAASRIGVYADQGSEQIVTSSQMLYVPAGIEYKIASVSVFSRIFHLTPSASQFEMMLLDNNISSALQIDLMKPAVLRLSRWMDDIVDRYFFERCKNDQTPAGCPQFLEKQILNEFVRLRFQGALKTTGKMIGQDKQSDIEILIEWIQAHLFDELDLSVIANAVHLSESQVNRIFASQLGMTPMAFVYGQRLEEAARLVERAELSLTDIAAIVGFSELSAFSRAFKKKFKVTPGKYVATINV